MLDMWLFFSTSPHQWLLLHSTPKPRALPSFSNPYASPPLKPHNPTPPLLHTAQNSHKETSMAHLHPISLITLLLLTTLLSSFVISHSQPPLLNPAEQDSVYCVLDSVNPDVSWHTIFPDDLCSNALHGVVCNYFTNDTDPSVVTIHVSELSFDHVSWHTIFPDDLCSNAPHGVVCDYFTNDTDPSVVTVHVSELSFGHVSDYTTNPPCSSTAVLSPLLFTAFPYLPKLFFYRCFNQTAVVVSVSDITLRRSQSQER